MHALSKQVMKDLEAVLKKYGAPNYIIGFTTMDEPMDVVYYKGSPFWAKGAATNLSLQLTLEANEIYGYEEDEDEPYGD